MIKIWNSVIYTKFARPLYTCSSQLIYFLQSSIISSLLYKNAKATNINSATMIETSSNIVKKDVFILLTIFMVFL